MQSKNPSIISRIIALFLATALLITSCKTAPVSTRAKSPNIAPKSSEETAKPVEKISSLDSEKDFASSFSHFYVVESKSDPGLKLTGEKEVVGAIVGSIIGAGILVGGGIAIKKFLSKPESKLDSNSAFVKVGGTHSYYSRAYYGNFDDLVFKITKENAPVGMIKTLEEAKLPPNKRALVVIEATKAQEMALGPIGSSVRRNVSGTGDVQYQVLGRNKKYLLIAAQRVDDINAGIFPINLVVVEGEPWKEAPLLGKGAQGYVFDVDGYAVKISNYFAEAELATVSLMQHIDGIIKVKGMYQTHRGQLAIVYEKLQKKDFTTMSDAEFKRVAKDLATTVDEMHKSNFQHNDISHNNIMFRGEKPVLIDPGIAGTTYGFNDSIALAESLINLRKDKQIMHDFIEMYGKIFNQLEATAKKIGGENIENVQGNLVRTFILNELYFRSAPRKLQKKNYSKANFNEWAPSMFGEYEIGMLTYEVLLKFEKFKSLDTLDDTKFMLQWDLEFKNKVKEMAEQEEFPKEVEKKAKAGDPYYIMILKTYVAEAQVMADLKLSRKDNPHYLLRKLAFAESDPTLAKLFELMDEKITLSNFINEI